MYIEPFIQRQTLNSILLLQVIHRSNVHKSRDFTYIPYDIIIMLLYYRRLFIQGVYRLKQVVRE